MSIESSIPPCWSKEGILGEATCPRLAEHVHCRNCPVYAEGGRTLLDRPPPEDYVQEQTRLLAQEEKKEEDRKLSLVVFRVGREWLAVETALFSRISPVKPVHRIPHRTGRLLSGLVNMDGELLLCASMEGLLGIGAEEEKDKSPESATRRMLVLGKGASRWVFEVDEVDRIHHVREGDVMPPPDTVARAAVAHTRGVVRMGQRFVSVLDERRLVEPLEKLLGGLSSCGAEAGGGK